MSEIADAKKITALVYAKPKRGKTLGIIAAAPCARFAGYGTGLDTADWLGLDISKRKKTCNTLEELADDLVKYGSKFPAYVGDDVSLMAQRSYENIRRNTAGDNKFAVSDKFNRVVDDVMQAVDEAKCDVFFTMHEQDPKDKVRKVDGETTVIGTIAGCPMIKGWQWPEQLPSMFAFVAHVVWDDSFAGWPWVYQTGPDPDYITGDRYSVTPPKFPQNLAEILRASGRNVPTYGRFR